MSAIRPIRLGFELLPHAHCGDLFGGPHPGEANADALFGVAVAELDGNLQRAAPGSAACGVASSAAAFSPARSR